MARKFIKEKKRGKLVLDITCGLDHGSYMIAKESTLHVIGADYDRLAIKNIVNKYFFCLSLITGLETQPVGKKRQGNRLTIVLSGLTLLNMSPIERQ